MYCSKCGAQIEDEAVICVHCGCPTQNYNKKETSTDAQPIVINNSASAAATAVTTKTKIKYSTLLDIIMLFMTGGLWIIWMILRPKYA